MNHLTKAELEAGLDTIRQAPRDGGKVEYLVRRPRLDEREVIAAGQLDPVYGLVGDYWHSRSSARAGDGPLDSDNQVTLINARLIALVAQEQARWALAGDQLYVDLDLSVDNLPPGTQLQVGTALLEVTALPHTGCEKFMARYGRDAVLFVNSPTGKALRLRGMNTRVVAAGRVRVGDPVTKL
jgi:hypothetical protein